MGHLLVNGQQLNDIFGFNPKNRVEFIDSKTGEKFIENVTNNWYQIFENQSSVIVEDLNVVCILSAVVSKFDFFSTEIKNQVLVVKEIANFKFNNNQYVIESRNKLNTSSYETTDIHNQQKLKDKNFEEFCLDENFERNMKRISYCFECYSNGYYNDGQRDVIYVDAPGRGKSNGCQEDVGHFAHTNDVYCRLYYFVYRKDVEDFISTFDFEQFYKKHDVINKLKNKSEKFISRQKKYSEKKFVQIEQQYNGLKTRKDYWNNTYK